MPEPLAETIHRAADDLHKQAVSAARNGRYVHLDPDLVRLLADTLRVASKEMRETTLVREADLCDDRGDWRPVVVSGRMATRHHTWTALLAVARAHLCEATNG